MRTLCTVTVVAFALLLNGCQSAYYGAMEQVGYHKRDIMADRVEEAKASQQEAQQQFSSALEEMQALLNHDGGDLETAYNQAKDEYEAAQKVADEVSSRINDVADVADALFNEWKTEIAEISKASLRRNSSAKLTKTKQSYKQLMTTMRGAESKMQPVLISMKDNMLYLKHNLNAQAIGAIKGEFTNLQTDIAVLIKDMNKSIAESSQFIATLEGN